MSKSESTHNNKGEENSEKLQEACYMLAFDYIC